MYNKCRDAVALSCVSQRRGQIHPWRTEKEEIPMAKKYVYLFTEGNATIVSIYVATMESIFD